MRYLFLLMLPFALYADGEVKKPQQPTEEVYEEDDTGEVDEDIIIQEEENTNDDEGVHN